MSFILAGLLALTACSNQIRDDNLVLDYDWEPDVYNLVYSHVADADNLRFWVRRAPEYDEGSPTSAGVLKLPSLKAPTVFTSLTLILMG